MSALACGAYDAYSAWRAVCVCLRLRGCVCVRVGSRPEMTLSTRAFARVYTDSSPPPPKASLSEGRQRAALWAGRCLRLRSSTIRGRSTSVRVPVNHAAPRMAAHTQAPHQVGWRRA